MAAEIRTREVIKGTIRTFDRGSAMAARTKDAYVKTKAFTVGASKYMAIGQKTHMLRQRRAWNQQELQMTALLLLMLLIMLFRKCILQQEKERIKLM